jgi:hypothetical protein
VGRSPHIHVPHLNKQVRFTSGILQKAQNLGTSTTAPRSKSQGSERFPGRLLRIGENEDESRGSDPQSHLLTCRDVSMLKISKNHPGRLEHQKIKFLTFCGYKLLPDWLNQARTLHVGSEFPDRRFETRSQISRATHLRWWIAPRVGERNPPKMREPGKISATCHH